MGMSLITTVPVDVARRDFDCGSYGWARVFRTRMIVGVAAAVVALDNPPGHAVIVVVTE